MTPSNCPCDSSKSYEACCGAIHLDQTKAITAEQLMRSRYSAFALENEAYLLQSWHPDTRPNTIGFDEQCKWLGLKIKATQQGSASDSEGQVSFVARYKVAGQAHRIVEFSHFIKIEGKWYYHSARDE